MELLEKLSNDLTERFNEIGLRANPQTIKLVGDAINDAIQVGGTIVIRFNKSRTKFSIYVVPPKEVNDQAEARRE